MSPHAAPTPAFVRRISRFNEIDLRTVALQIHNMLLDEQDLLDIERVTREELLEFSKGESIDNKPLLFWRAARIVQTRGLEPETTTPFTHQIWELLQNVSVRTDTQTTPTFGDRVRSLAREADRRHGSRARRAEKVSDAAGDSVEAFNQPSSGSSGSTSGSGGSGDGCLSELINGIFGIVRGVRRF